MDPERLKQSQFRKKKKLEKRRTKRQLNTKNCKSNEQVNQNSLETSTNDVEQQQLYEREKALWEEREQKFKLIEVAKKKAKEKQEKAKKLSQKRWQDTLLNLPLMPPNITADRKNTPFKTFVQPSQEVVKKKTYRDRYLEKKLENSLRKS
ncbi:unnamed protein product [Mucor hiemalis]